MKRNNKLSTISGLLSVILTLSISFASCNKAPLTNGDVVTKTTALPSFNTIYINDNIDVNLIKSDTFMIKVTTGDNLMENIISEVIDSVLFLRNENILNWIRSYDYPLCADVYFKSDIKKIHYESVGYLKTDDYICDDTLSTLSLVLMEGSGDIELKYNCRSFSMFCNDGCTSKITIEGKSVYGNINQRGLGPIYTVDLPCRNMSVRSTDINNIFIHCTDNLDAKIYNSGNIYYKGQPEINSYLSPGALGRLIEIENLKN